MGCFDSLLILNSVESILFWDEKNKLFIIGKSRVDKTMIVDIFQELASWKMIVWNIDIYGFNQSGFEWFFV